MTSRKRLTLFLCAVLVVGAAIGGFLLFGSDRTGAEGNGSVSSSVTPSNEESIAGREVLAAASKLTADMTSGNEAVYKAAWAHANTPPMPPSGTKITVSEDTAKAHESYGRINATVTMPGKNVKSVIHLKRSDDSQWRVYLIEEVK